MATNQEYNEYRVLELPGTGYAGDRYYLNVGGGKYQTYIVSDSLELTKEAGNEFIECDTVDDLRALDSRQIWAIQNGYYKGVKLNGYYAKGDTPTPIEYYLSDTVESDDGGSVFEVGGIKLEHEFVNTVDSRYFGLKRYSIENQSVIIQKVLDFGADKLIKIYFPSGIYYINGRHSTGGRGMLIRSNSDIETDENTFFKVIPQVLGSYQAFALVDVENIYINRLNVIGEKDEHVAPEGVWLPWLSNRSVNVGEYIYFNNWGFKVLSTGNLSTTKTIFSGLSKGDVVTNGTATLEVTNVSTVQEWVPEGGGTLGEWGMGISFLGAKNVTIDYFNAENFWGDGIYLGHSSTRDRNVNINIGNAYIENTRRQGMSVENVDGLFINDITIKNVSGTAPGSGIDFEPLYETDAIKRVNIGKVECHNSDNYAVILVGHLMGEDTDPIDIWIGEIFDYNCGSIRVSGNNYEYRRNGLLKVNTIHSQNARNHCFQTISIINGIDLDIGDIYINNANQSNDVYPFGAGIRAHVESGTTLPSGVPTKIRINNVYATSTDGNMTGVIDVYEHNQPANSPPIIDFSITGNVISNGVLLQNNTYRIKSKGVINYKGLRPKLNEPETISVSQSTVCRLSNSGRTSNTLYSLSNLPIGYKITIEVSDPYAVGIDNTFDFKLFHYSDLESRRLSSAIVGSYITISHLGGNIWDVEEMVGRWYYNTEVLRNTVTTTSTEKQGIIQLATQTQVNNGVNPITAVTPSTLQGKLNDMNATPTVKGLVNQALSVGEITTPDATDEQTTMDLVNELKEKINELLIVEKNSGQMES